MDLRTLNHMELDTTNQQIKPVQEPPQNQPLLNVANHKWFVPVIIGVAILLSVIAGGAYYLGTQKNQTSYQSNSQQASPSPFLKQTPTTTITNTSYTPKLASFMRQGEIFVKDFATNKETKVSKTPKVGSPYFSSDGKYLAYFSIVHAGDGFPRTNLYLSDVQTGTETLLGLTNEFASRITWSKTGNYVGYILFPDGQASKAVLYDAGLRKKVTEVEVSSLRTDGSNIPVLTTDKSYNVSLNCNQLQASYIDFCNEFESVLNRDAKPYSGSYKAEQFSKSQYTKANYQLTRSERLDNGLIVLEYYTGEPQNPESKWGIGGGVFVPGYDEGVTQTYTVLIDEISGKVITEIPLAVNTKFIFQ